MQGINWTQIIGSSLVSFMLSLMLVRVWTPFGPRAAGEVLLEVPLSLPQRLQVHRTQVLVLSLYVFLGSPEIQRLLFGAQGWYLPGTEFAAVGGLVLLVFLPMRYVFTDEGVRINHGVLRQYRLFRRFDVRPTRIVLQPKRRASSFVLHVYSDQQQPVVRLLKRQLR